VFTFTESTVEYYLSCIFLYTSSGPHNCSQNNGLCSDFCLLKPGGYQCACPTGIALKSDGKNCDYGTAFYFNSLAPLPSKEKKQKQNKQTNKKNNQQTKKQIDYLRNSFVAINAYNPGNMAFKIQNSKSKCHVIMNTNCWSRGCPL